MWKLLYLYGGSMPFPLAPWTILISSGNDPRFNWTVAGLGSPGGGTGQLSVAYWDTDTPAEMGARIWHEMLHCYGIPADSLQSTERDGFTEYLRTTGSPHYAGFSQDPTGYELGSNHTPLLIAYYTYLTEKYHGCETEVDPCDAYPCKTGCPYATNCTVCPNYPGCNIVEDPCETYPCGTGCPYSTNCSICPNYPGCKTVVPPETDEDRQRKLVLLALGVGIAFLLM